MVRVYDYRFFDRVTLSLRFRVFVLVTVTFSTLTIVGEGVEQRESADPKSALGDNTLAQHNKTPVGSWHI
jgi:hypothetical protein